jgi:hypothetical protein
MKINLCGNSLINKYKKLFIIVIIFQYKNLIVTKEILNILDINSLN